MWIWWLSAALAAPFGTIPVQGMVEGVGSPDGSQALTFRIKVDGVAVHTETVPVILHGGGFAATLGATGAGVDFANLQGTGALTVTVQPAGSDESPPVPIAWAPRAAWALNAATAANATALDGQPASAYRLAATPINWSEINPATIPALGSTYSGASPVTVSGSTIGLDLAALRATLANDFVAKTTSGTSDFRLATQTTGTCPSTVAVGTIQFDGSGFRGCTSNGWVSFTNASPGSAPSSAASSCKTLNLESPSLPSGAYWMAGNGSPYQVYCDMSSGNAGWTLVLRADAASSNFHFFSTHWTTASTLNPNAPFEPNAAGDAKFRSFNEISATEIRGCMRHSGTGVYGCKAYGLPTAQTALNLFTNTPVGSDVTGKGLYFSETPAQAVGWLTNMGLSLADMSSGTGAGYVKSGINLDDDQSCYHARTRFGLLLNNESVVGTANDGVGFGASAYWDSNCGVTEGSWRVSSGAASGSTTYNRAGAIWVR